MTRHSLRVSEEGLIIREMSTQEKRSMQKVKAPMFQVNSLIKTHFGNWRRLRIGENWSGMLCGSGFKPISPISLTKSTVKLDAMWGRIQTNQSRFIG